MTEYTPGDRVRLRANGITGTVCAGDFYDSLAEVWVVWDTLDGRYGYRARDLEPIDTPNPKGER